MIDGVVTVVSIGFIQTVGPTSYSYCAVSLLMHSIDTCFWHTSPRRGVNVACVCNWISLAHNWSAALYQPVCYQPTLILTSSNENIFRVTGHLCGEFTGHRWIPLTKASDVELWCFFCAWTNGWVNNREAGDLRRNRAHDDVTVMLPLITP